MDATHNLEIPTTTPAIAAAFGKPSHAQFVGSIPETYDTHLGPLLFEFSAADTAKRVGEHLEPGARVLEVACGTGISTEFLWQVLDHTTQIIATDLNDAMLDHARETRGALTNVTFEQADAQALPYDNDAFDALVCQFGIMFFPDKAKAFAEFNRVLKPGGLLVFNVWDSFEHNRVAGIAHDTITRFFEDNPPGFLTVPFGSHEITPNCDLINTAGFDVLDIQKVPATIERPDAESVARGFVEGTPGLLQIREHATSEVEDIVQAVAREIEHAYGPGPLGIPLQEIVYLARCS